VGYSIAGSALAVPSRASATVRMGGAVPSIGLFTRVRGRVDSQKSMCRTVQRASVL
jgi:hypothetical protein